MLFDTKIKIDGKRKEVRRQLIREDGRCRTEYSNGRYTIVARAKHSVTRLDVDPAMRTARITYGISQDEPDPLNSIRNMLSSEAARPMDARRIGGRLCPGFLIELELNQGHPQQMRLWIDPATRLPVYYEVVAKNIDTTPGADDSAHYTARCSNFKYDVALDDSLFALTPPDGYELTSEGAPQTQAPQDWPPEKLVISAGDGIGPARFGMSREQVSEIIGEPEQRRTPNVAHDGELWEYHSQGITLFFSDGPEPRLKQVTCRGWNNNFVSRDFRGKTKEGIGLGASPSDVRRAFGDPQFEQPIKDGIGGFHYADKRLRLGFSEGQVFMLTTWGARQARSAPPDESQ